MYLDRMNVYVMLLLEMSRYAHRPLCLLLPFLLSRYRAPTKGLSTACDDLRSSGSDTIYDFGIQLD